MQDIMIQIAINKAISSPVQPHPASIGYAFEKHTQIA